MRRILRSAAVLAVACGTAGVASAQTTQAAAQPSTPVAYSGCLKAGADLATGSTLTPGKSPTVPLSGFVLTSAQPSAATSAPTGQSPTTTTPPATPPTTEPRTNPTGAGAAATAGAAAGVTGNSMYRIVGMQDVELQKFVNQQVEVRGVLESPDTTATTGTAGTPTTSQPSSTTTNPATGTSGTTAAVGTSSGSNPGQAGAAVQTFRASSVRVLSTTCTGGGTQ